MEIRREFRDSKYFKKKLCKLRGQNLINVMNKIDEILSVPNLNFYKNLKHDLKKYKRVHINNSFIILFFGDDNLVYFVDYVSHDEAYKCDKKTLRKYLNLKFD